MTVDEYIDALESPQREIAQKLRSIILETDSKLSEQIKWNAPVYSLNRNICSIIAHKQHVNLQLFQGASIKDAKQLEGTGKDMRHIKFSTATEIKKTDIQRYLNQVLEHDRAR